MRVLIIEDEVQLARHIRRALYRTGHETATESDGLARLRAALEHSPDLIILDLNLPTMGGFDVLARLKEERSSARICVEITSAIFRRGRGSAITNSSCWDRISTSSGITGNSGRSSTKRAEIPGFGSAGTVAYFIEGKYKFTPQWYAALRWNQQIFDDLPNPAGGEAPWGIDLYQVDVATGYRFTAHTQL